MRGPTTLLFALLTAAVAVNGAPPEKMSQPVPMDTMNHSPGRVNGRVNAVGDIYYPVHNMQAPKLGQDTSTLKNQKVQRSDEKQKTKLFPGSTAHMTASMYHRLAAGSGKMTMHISKKMDSFLRSVIGSYSDLEDMVTSLPPEHAKLDDSSPACDYYACGT